LIGERPVFQCWKSGGSALTGARKIGQCSSSDAKSIAGNLVSSADETDIGTPSTPKEPMKKSLLAIVALAFAATTAFAAVPAASAAVAPAKKTKHVKHHKADPKTVAAVKKAASK
jgi:hypothetical protein